MSLRAKRSNLFFEVASGCRPRNDNLFLAFTIYTMISASTDLTNPDFPCGFKMDLGNSGKGFRTMLLEKSAACLYNL